MPILTRSSFFLPILLLAASSPLSHAVTPASSSPTFVLPPAASSDLTVSLTEKEPAETASLPDAPDAVQTTAGTSAAVNPDQGPQQTKRILFIVPNFRSVSADQKLPPMSPKQKFKLVLDDTFDYSSFIEVGIIAGVADLHKSEPAFGHGAVAYGRYYWHNLADTIDGNLMTEFVVPVAAHEDPRYYTLGHGNFLKRTVYSISRLAITRSDNGNPTPNFAEIVGNGASAGISNFYYPRDDRTWTKTGQRWVTQVGIDGLSNLVKEFWPDINAKLFHNKE